ncbi:hypothetical protein GCM10009813_08130 [Brevibacterium marinum]
MPRWVRVVEALVPGGPWVVAAIGEAGVAFLCLRGTTIIDDRTIALIGGLTTPSVIRGSRLSVGGRTLIGDRLAVADRTLLGNRRLLANTTLLGNWALLGNPWVVRGRTPLGCRATVVDRRLVRDPRIVSVPAFVRNGAIVIRDPSVAGHGLPIIRYRTRVVRNGPPVIRDRPAILDRPAIVDGAPVGIVTSVGNPIGLWACTGSRAGSRSGSRTSCRSGSCARSCTGCRSGTCVRVFGDRTTISVCVHIGIEFFGVLHLALVLGALFLRQTITLGGVGVQLLRLGGPALGLCGLHLGVGVGLLRFGLATLGVRFPSMDLRFGLGGFLTDPGCFLALVFALLGGSLATDCDDDADDNQNYDDCYDYPDDSCCIHVFSPCCLFGSH